MSINQQNTDQSSERKIQANRENAQQSTGPRTEAGKTIVSRNAVKHGLLAKALTFENEEEKEALEQFRAEMQEELEPQGMVEKMLVEEIVMTWWKVQTAQSWSTQELYSRRKATIAKLHRVCP